MSIKYCVFPQTRLDHDYKQRRQTKAYKRDVALYNRYLKYYENTRHDVWFLKDEDTFIKYARKQMQQATYRVNKYLL